MKEKLRFLGLDVHAETIAVAVAEPEGEVRSLGTIPNRAESIRKLIKKLGPAEKLRACYEAGPTGYVMYWRLAELGVHCEVVAPTLVPVKAGDRVKTDRRDAKKLARCYRSGGAVPSEDSSGRRTRRGGITKTGNAHLRRVVVEAHGAIAVPVIWYGLRRRQENISEEAEEIAWKAQHRLHKRYMKLGAAGKDQSKIVTAVAPELLGFIRAIGTRAKMVARQGIAA